MNKEASSDNVVILHNKIFKSIEESDHCRVYCICLWKLEQFIVTGFEYSHFKCMCSTLPMKICKYKRTYVYLLILEQRKKNCTLH